MKNTWISLVSDADTLTCYPTIQRNKRFALIGFTDRLNARGEWRRLPFTVPCIHSSKVFVVWLASEEHVLSIIGRVAL